MANILNSDITYPARYICLNIGTGETSRSYTTDDFNNLETHPACQRDYVSVHKKARNTPISHSCCLSSYKIGNGDCCKTECDSKITYRSYTPGQKNRFNVNNSDSQIGCSYDSICKATCFNAPPCTRASDQYRSKSVFPGSHHVHKQAHCPHNYPM